MHKGHILQVVRPALDGSIVGPVQLDVGSLQPMVIYYYISLQNPPPAGQLQAPGRRAPANTFSNEDKGNQPVPEGSVQIKQHSLQHLTNLLGDVVDKLINSS